jgi:glyoxylase-like metal-dependent hydrolase (beta-lactamase superfamily II)
MKRLAAITLLAGLCVNSVAHEFTSPEEYFAAIDFDSAEVRTETIAPGLHVLFGIGGNIMVSIGDQGVLMVDSQFPQMIPKLMEAVGELGGDGVDFTINTHWHFDHADGNPLLGRAGSWMVSHINSRRMMAGEHDIDTLSMLYRQPPYPMEGMPVVTYSDKMQMHFNGERIDLLHYGPAHTTGDTAVIFRNSNVVHMGDVFNASYPFIDAGNGGDINGMIRFCEKILASLNEDSTIVPGHGPVMAYDDMAQYIAMLETISMRISNMIDGGMTLEEVIAAKPTEEFDERYGDPVRLINRAYMSLAR